MNDDYLRTHVIFLLMLSKVFVGYNFTGKNQAILINEIKSIKNCNKLVTLTNGINDEKLVRLTDFRYFVTK